MIDPGDGSKTPPRLSRFQKFALGVQVFLLRRGWMGPASEFIMVITTTGRKTGKQTTIPISYKWDGENIIALNQGNSNWFRNVAANGSATLEVKRLVMQVRGEVVQDDTERKRIFDVYKTDPAVMNRLFHIGPEAPEAELEAVRSKWQFVKFSKTDS